MKKVSLKKISIFLAAIIALIMMFSVVSFAAPEDAADTTAAVTAEADEATVVDNSTSTKAIAAGFGMAIASVAGAISMAIAIKSSTSGVARQPEAAGSIQTLMMLGLVFIETAIIYALIIAILIVFVL